MWPSEEELEGRLVELNNGCLCCTVQDDFLPPCRPVKRADSLDAPVETSVWPTATSVAARSGLKCVQVVVNGVITVVDGEALEGGSPVGDPDALERQRLEDPSLDHIVAIEELFEDQLQAADQVLISRADRLNPGQLQSVRDGLLNRVRSGTPLLPIERGVIDPAVVLGMVRQASAVEAEVDHDTATATATITITATTTTITTTRTWMP